MKVIAVLFATFCLAAAASLPERSSLSQAKCVVSAIQGVSVITPTELKDLFEDAKGTAEKLVLGYEFCQTLNIEGANWLQQKVYDICMTLWEVQLESEIERLKEKSHINEYVNVIENVKGCGV